MGICENSAFVISSQEIDTFRVFEFEPEEQSNDLDTELSPIDVVSEKDILSLRRQAMSIKNGQQIKKLPGIKKALPMDIPDDDSRRSRLQYIGLKL